jgi:ubiquinone/menaquinone biosynthesis C-methylase UbiE
MLARVYGGRPGRLDLAADVARRAGVNESSTVLEIGCGDGATAVYLAQSHGCRVVGIDSAQSMVTMASQRVAEAGLEALATSQQASAGRLPFRAGAVNMIWSESVLSTLPDKSAAVTEFWRVLQPGGRLVILDFVLRSEVSRELQQQVVLIPCLGRTRQITEYISLFEEAGFHDPYCRDLSDEVKKSGYWLGIMYGSMQALLARLSAGSCACAAEGKVNPRAMVEGFGRFLKEANLGYALIMMTRS